MSVEVAERYKFFCRKCLDFHTHFAQPEVLQTSYPNWVTSGFGQRPAQTDSPSIRPMLDPEIAVQDMNARGVDFHVLCSCDVVQSRVWAEPDEEYRLTRLVNDECVSWVERHPDRFIGSAVLPLVDMKNAIGELERMHAQAFKVVQLPSNVRGDYLGHKRFADLLERIRAYNMVIFLHPEGVTDPWYQPYWMWNSIGQSIEEVRCMTSLIYEGVMDRLSGIKIVMAHGGGYMPHYMGRLDRNYIEKPFVNINISKKPSEYLRDFYYDSCVYDARTLELLVERVGIDRIVLGGDYPVAAVDPIDFLENVRLPDEDRAKIAGGNALSLLGLT